MIKLNLELFWRTVIDGLMPSRVRYELAAVHKSHFNGAKTWTGGHEEAMLRRDTILALITSALAIPRIWCARRLCVMAIPWLSGGWPMPRGVRLAAGLTLLWMLNVSEAYKKNGEHACK